MPHLYRVSDNAGDSGARSEAWKIDYVTKKAEVVSNRPTIGCKMLVGSVTARSYSSQDYWLTTEVKRIIEESTDFVTFETVNGSIYEWRP